MSHLRSLDTTSRISTLRIPFYAISTSHDPAEVGTYQMISFAFCLLRHPILRLEPKAKLFLLLYNYKGWHSITFSTVVKTDEVMFIHTLLRPWS